MTPTVVEAVVALLEQVITLARASNAGTITEADLQSRLTAAAAALAAVEAADDAALAARFPPPPTT